MKRKPHSWRCRGLNPGPHTCEARALPLSYIPGCSAPAPRAMRGAGRARRALTGPGRALRRRQPRARCRGSRPRIRSPRPALTGPERPRWRRRHSRQGPVGRGPVAEGAANTQRCRVIARIVSAPPPVTSGFPNKSAASESSA